MRRYQLTNNVLGWVIFVIAAVVYLMTIEPTTSFWDCGEFIASAYKLQVGHPPGAPVFMLMGNLFSQLASDLSQVSVMLNVMSAVFSALTILLLFWTITHLTKRLIVGRKQEEMTLAQMITIFGAGAVGALAYAFSDTFWFSAVEAEVYAFSSLMTAFVFWLILKWEDVADEPHSDRWLILIAYLIGLSIAIHLLNLLCIPAIVLVYYFRRTANPTWKGAVIALLISFGILAAILYGLVQGLVEVCGWFELLFVNVFKMPYNSGVIFYLILILGVLAWAIWESMQDTRNSKRAKLAFIIAIALLGIPFIGSGVWLGIFIIAGLTVYLFNSKKVNPVALNTILVGLFIVTIGYSSYALIMIRSTSNPPMDQNSPDDIFTLGSYLSREQYGEVPLFYGRTFVSEVKYERKGGGHEAIMEDRGPIWTRIYKNDPSEKDRYYKSGRKRRFVYVDELNMLFPRMHSSDSRHIQEYKKWSNFKGQRVRIANPQANWVVKPTFAENLRFFFNYQVNFMYWRYFMWNFSGRQNDIQGSGEVANGNWITGIKFIDTKLAGPQDDLPDFIGQNKGNNKYYMLPLLLGILGIFFQVYSGKKGTQQFWVTFLLFFMTGLAIVIYLNQTPYQPRERDYAYAGSFYAFCIWIGIGTAGIIRGLNKYLKVPPTASAAIGAFLCLLVPLQMISQTWDDHDRSGRFIARDFGMNYLMTCEPNAIIFTNGDNDTFPLWYAQEVEGFRTDVRVCNLSYLQTDWYIDQMKREAYESQPLPIKWTRNQYVQGKNDVAYVFDAYKEIWDVGRVLDRIRSEDIRDQRIPGYSVEITNVPTLKIAIPVDSAGVIASGAVKSENADWILPHLLIDLGERRNANGELTMESKKYLGKQEMMVLEMLRNTSDWSRPIYYALTVGSEHYLRMENYFRQDGVAYRIMPFEAARHQRIDTDILYDNVMNKYKWGNLEQPGLYIDENGRRMSVTFRIIFGQLIQALIAEKDFERAEKALDYCLQVIPSYNVPYDFYSVNDLAEGYHRIGNTEKANGLYTELAEIYAKNLHWYNRLNGRQYASVLSDVRNNISFMQYILYFFSENNPEVLEKYAPIYSVSEEKYRNFVEGLRRGGANR
jgi:MFS family permease/tetratricopeptide (TPR) repeat protein